jgi:hypothetical protein
MQPSAPHIAQQSAATHRAPARVPPPEPDVPSFAEGHPELMALWRFWRACAADRRMPARADLDTIALKPWLGHLLLIDALSPRLMRFRVFGTRIAYMVGRDSQNRGIADLPPAYRDDMQRACEMAVRDRAPRFAERRHSFVCPDSFARRDDWLGLLHLPLSEDGVRVSQILVAIYPRSA